jgi:hypothetical protein
MRPTPRRGLPNQHPGYGFRLVGSPGHRRGVVDEQERRVMAMIVELRKQGKSWEGIAFELLRAKIVARTGQEWSVSRVRRAYFAEERLRGEELPGTKRCTGCGRVQPANKNHFWRKRQSPDGLNSQCHDCRRRTYRLTRERTRKTKAKRMLAALKGNTWAPKARRSMLDYLGGEEGFLREFKKAYDAAPDGSPEQCQMVLTVGRWLIGR